MDTQIEIGITELVDSYTPLDATDPWLIPRHKMVEMIETAWIMFDLEFKPNGTSYTTYYSDEKDMFFEPDKGWVKNASKKYAKTEKIPPYPCLLEIRQAMLTQEDEDGAINLFFFYSHLIEDKEVWDLRGFCSFYAFGNQEKAAYYKMDGKYLFGTHFEDFRNQFGVLSWMDSPMYLIGNTSGLFSGIKNSIQLGISNILRSINPIGGINNIQPVMSVMEIRRVLSQELLRADQLSILRSLIWFLHETTVNTQNTVECLHILYANNLHRALADFITKEGKPIATQLGTIHHPNGILDVEEDILTFASGYGTKLDLLDILKIDIVLKTTEDKTEIRNFFWELSRILDISTFADHKDLLDREVVKALKSI